MKHEYVFLGNTPKLLLSLVCIRITCEYFIIDAQFTPKLQVVEFNKTPWDISDEHQSLKMKVEG